MIDFNAFSNEVFQILRSYEKDIVLYDDNGTRVFEPEEARRMYVIGDNLLISIVEDGDNSALKFYLSPSFNLAQVEGLLETLRQISVQSNLLFHVKKYNKEIKPKDFAVQSAVKEQQENQMNIMEGLYGTSKSSYLKLENARMIVRHSARVNERVIGDRGRNISSIFVETQDGERYRFPVNMLSGARAMTQHVNNGGTFADEVGSQIIRMATDFGNLAQIANSINARPGISEAAKKKEPKIEAYGVKGVKSKPWRKVFPNQAAYEKFFDNEDNAGDIEVHGTRELEESVAEDVQHLLAVRKAVYESLTKVKRSFDRMYEAKTYVAECQRVVDAAALMETSEDLGAKVEAWTAILGEGYAQETLLSAARLVTLPEAQTVMTEDAAEEIEEADIADEVDECEYSDAPIIEDQEPVAESRKPAKPRMDYLGECANNPIMKQFGEWLESYDPLAMFGESINESDEPHFDQRASMKAAQPVEAALNSKFAGYFNTELQRDGSVKFVQKGGVSSIDHDASNEFVLSPQNLSKVINPFFYDYRKKGWTFSQPAGGEFFVGVPAHAAVKEADELEETFNGELEQGDLVRITARGPYFGKQATILRTPANGDDLFTVSVAGKPYRIGANNFNVPSMMSKNTDVQPEPAMSEDMVQQLNKPWKVKGVIGLNSPFVRGFDSELERDEWLAKNQNNDRIEVIDVIDPVAEGVLRKGSKAYNEVSRLASSNIDRRAEEKQKAKQIKARSDAAWAKAHGYDKKAEEEKKAKEEKEAEEAKKEKVDEGAVKDLVSEVTEAGWYAFNTKGKVEQGPEAKKADIDAKYHDSDEHTVQYVGKDDITEDLEEGAADKRWTVTKTKGDREYTQTGTLSELIKAYSYTLDTGASYSHEKGNKKIDRQPKTIRSLVSNLNAAVNNAAANGYAGVHFTAKEAAAVDEGKSFKRNDDEGGEKKQKDQERKEAAKNKRQVTEAQTRGSITIDDGTILVNGKQVGEVYHSRKNGYHPAVKLVVGPHIEWLELDTPDLIDTIFAKVKSTLKIADEVTEATLEERTMIEKGPDNEDYWFAAGSKVGIIADHDCTFYTDGTTIWKGKAIDAATEHTLLNDAAEMEKHFKALQAAGKLVEVHDSLHHGLRAEVPESVQVNEESVAALEAKVKKLQKEYADCDDFVSARHEIKAELDAAKEKLAKAKNVSESVKLAAGTFFKLAGNSELKYCKRVDESRVLVSNADGTEVWAEAAELKVDPASVRAVQK